MSKEDANLTVSVTEPVHIDGIGDIIAKVDTGNDGHNVIHGVHPVFSNGNVTFKTVNGKFITKKVIDTIVVHIGGGHQQKRPVIELDFQIRDKIYKKALFSVADRSKNDMAVLLSKPFLEKAGAVVDVKSNAKEVLPESSKITFNQRVDVYLREMALVANKKDKTLRVDTHSDTPTLNDDENVVYKTLSADVRKQKWDGVYTNLVTLISREYDRNEKEKYERTDPKVGQFIGMSHILKRASGKNVDLPYALNGMTPDAFATHMIGQGVVNFNKLVQSGAVVVDRTAREWQLSDALDSVSGVLMVPSSAKFVNNLHKALVQGVPQFQNKQINGVSKLTYGMLVPGINIKTYEDILNTWNKPPVKIPSSWEHCVLLTKTLKEPEKHDGIDVLVKSVLEQLACKIMEIDYTLNNQPQPVNGFDPKDALSFLKNKPGDTKIPNDALNSGVSMKDAENDTLTLDTIVVHSSSELKRSTKYGDWVVCIDDNVSSGNTIALINKHVPADTNIIHIVLFDRPASMVKQELYAAVLDRSKEGLYNSTRVTAVHLKAQADKERKEREAAEEAAKKAANDATQQTHRQNKAEYDNKRTERVDVFVNRVKATKAIIADISKRGREPNIGEILTASQAYKAARALVYDPQYMQSWEASFNSDNKAVQTYKAKVLERVKKEDDREKGVQAKGI